MYIKIGDETTEYPVFINGASEIWVKFKWDGDRAKEITVRVEPQDLIEVRKVNFCAKFDQLEIRGHFADSFQLPFTTTLTDCYLNREQVKIIDYGKKVDYKDEECWEKSNIQPDVKDGAIIIGSN